MSVECSNIPRGDPATPNSYTYGSPDAPLDVYRGPAQYALLASEHPFIYDNIAADPERFVWLMRPISNHNDGTERLPAAENGLAEVSLLGNVTDAESLLECGITAVDIARGLQELYLGEPQIPSLEGEAVASLLRGIRKSAETERAESTEFKLSELQQANRIIEEAIIELIRTIPDSDFTLMASLSDNEIALKMSKDYIWKNQRIINSLLLPASLAYGDPLFHDETSLTYRVDLAGVAAVGIPADDLMTRKKEEAVRRKMSFDEEFSIVNRASKLVARDIVHNLLRRSEVDGQQVAFSELPIENLTKISCGNSDIAEIAKAKGISPERLSQLLYAELRNIYGENDWAKWTENFTATSEDPTAVFRYITQFNSTAFNIWKASEKYGGEKGLQELTDHFGITIFSRFSSLLMKNVDLDDQLAQLQSGVLTADRIVFLPRSDHNNAFEIPEVNEGESVMYFEVGTVEEMNSHILTLSKMETANQQLGLYILGHGLRGSLNLGFEHITTDTELFGGKKLSEIFPDIECFVYLDSCSNGKGTNVGTPKETWQDNLATHVANSLGAQVVALSEKDSLRIHEPHKLGDAPLSSRAYNKVNELGIGFEEEEKPAQPSQIERIKQRLKRMYTLPAPTYGAQPEHSTYGAVLTVFPEDSTPNKR